MQRGHSAKTLQGVWRTVLFRMRWAKLIAREKQHVAENRRLRLKLRQLLQSQTNQNQHGGCGCGPNGTQTNNQQAAPKVVEGKLRKKKGKRAMRALKEEASDDADVPSSSLGSRLAAAKDSLLFFEKGAPMSGAPRGVRKDCRRSRSLRTPRGAPGCTQGLVAVLVPDGKG